MVRVTRATTPGVLRYAAAAALNLALALACLAPPLASAQLATAAAAPRQLCSCQIDGQMPQCMQEVYGLCATAGEYARAIPMCNIDWSGVIAMSPAVFMEVLKAASVLCRHPYQFNVTEMASFLGATAFGHLAPAFVANGITGAFMTQLTKEELTDNLNASLGDAMMFMEGKNTFLESTGPPLNRGKMPARDIAEVQLGFNVRQLSEIDEVKFEFHVAFDLVMHWSDMNIWADCKASGAKEIEKGPCQYVWKPQLAFPNARSYEIADGRSTLWTDVATKTATYTLDVTGTFAAPMTFRTFPMDAQDLPITVAFSDSNNGLVRRVMRWAPVAAQLDAKIEDTEGGKDTLSGWTVEAASAREHGHVGIDWLEMAGDSGPMLDFMLSLKAASEAMTNVTMDFREQSTYSAATCNIHVKRTTVFYMLNYIMIVVLLTSLSWITFLMDPSDLNDRCGISLTLLLALNVFQLILSELMPKTGYLTPMHEFVIVSTFFTVLAAVEAVVSNQINKRVAVRAAVVDKMKTALAAGGASRKNVSGQKGGAGGGGAVSNTGWRPRNGSSLKPLDGDAPGSGGGGGSGGVCG